MENSFKSLLETSKSVLVLLPKNPYFDQVAAGLALYLVLGETREAAISCPSPMLVEFNQLVGVNKVTTETGNKNMVVKLTGYQPDNIERVKYDIQGHEAYLTVIPKPQMVPPKKDQVVIEFSGINSDTVILIGGANENHFPALSSEGALGARLVHIGIQEISLSEDRKVLSFAKPTSSVSELVANIMKENGMNYNRDIATNLLVGIHEGSKSFSHSSVSADTFRLASELMRAGGKYAPQKQAPKEVKQPQVPPGPGMMPFGARAQQPQPATAPKSWLQQPKVYKGTTIS